ncbi:MAG: hypothetical protein M2R45_03314 [Verrucomicrobia subdivision 3 bacterium]|nr:hypothetical protein [Limisphaerales bacterium]MCS1415408.1 hypothetical protein [Limisphaerales bacterium]
MSLRLQMLQVARLAPRVLEDATELVGNFLRNQQNPDGGFRDKSGNSDLYYTVFGIDASLALQLELDKAPLQAYIASFGTGEALGFVHLCSMIRCRAFVGFESGQIEAFLERLNTYRTPDGGFHPNRGFTQSTVYGNFLAYGAYQDLGQSVPDALRLVQSFKHLETGDSWANERCVKTGSTTATAAAVTVLRDQGMPVNGSVDDWLVARFHAMGGFLAAPQAPVPDLLSTATALHALAALEVPFGPFKELCLDYIDTLWTNEGSFYGHWQEETLDCEYTYYALLALGHLSVG